MDFAELARSRRSLRAYDPARPVPAELLDQILSTARWAPSAANRQPWRIIIVQSQNWLDRVHAAYPRDWFMSSPCVAVVCGLPAKAWTRTFDAWSSLETDLAIFMDHLTLAAWDLGVGSCWIGNFEPEVLKTALNLPDDETVFAMTPLGFAPTDNSGIRASARLELSESVLFL